MTENEIATKIIGCSLEVHRLLGPGLLESAYEAALSFELRRNHLDIFVQKPMPLIYKGITLDVGYRIDILIENKVVVELKSVERLAPVHFLQTLTYLKLSDLRLGLLINFNNTLLRNGIHRIVNNL